MLAARVFHCRSDIRCSQDVRMRPLLLILLLVCAYAASAQIYKYTDANGNTVYSDHSPDGVKAQAVELPPLNSVQPQAPSAPSSDAVSRAPARNAYEVLELTGLPTEEALRANHGP